MLQKQFRRSILGGHDSIQVHAESDQEAGEEEQVCFVCGIRGSGEGCLLHRGQNLAFQVSNQRVRRHHRFEIVQVERPGGLVSVELHLAHLQRDEVAFETRGAREGLRFGFGAEGSRQELVSQNAFQAFDGI